MAKMQEWQYQSGQVCGVNIALRHYQQTCPNWYFYLISLLVAMWISITPLAISINTKAKHTYTQPVHFFGIYPMEMHTLIYEQDMNAKFNSSTIVSIKKNLKNAKVQ